jgi:hypothetical protein
VKLPMRPLLCLLAAMLVAGSFSAQAMEGDKPFAIPRERIAAGVRRIAIMPVSIPASVPNRLQVAQRLEADIEAQVRTGGFEIVPAATMRAIHDDFSDALGGLYDPISGKPVEAQLKSLDGYVRELYESKNEVDAWLHTTVVARNVVVSAGKASWDGAIESIATGQTSAKAPEGVVPGLSLLVELKDNNGKLLYGKYGALQMTRLFHSNASGVRQVEVDPAQLMTDPEREKRALTIALQPLASGAESPAPAKQPPVQPVPMVANPDALKLPRAELLSGYKRVALLPLFFAQGSLQSAVVARYREMLDARLKTAGFEVVDAAEAGAAMDRLRKSAPGFHDPLTGVFDEARWNAQRLAILKDHARRLGVQAMVEPAMVVTAALINGNDAVWDGARENISGAKSPQGQKLSAVTAGTVPALSLSLRISDLADRRLFEEQMGIRLAAKQVGGQLYEVQQAELFNNPEAERKVVEQVLREIVAVPESAKKR